ILSTWVSRIASSLRESPLDPDDDVDQPSPAEETAGYQSAQGKAACSLLRQRCHINDEAGGRAEDQDDTRDDLDQNLRALTVASQAPEQADRTQRPFVGRRPAWPVLVLLDRCHEFLPRQPVRC